MAGEFPVGSTIPPELQLCEEYGVSRITVVRSLNELVREGFLARRRALGTFVLRTAPVDDVENRPRVVAFVAPRVDSDWILDIFAGLEAEAASGDYFVTLVSTNRSTAEEAARLRALIEQRVRGVAIYHALPGQNIELLASLRILGIPLVFVGSYDPDVVADRVEADNERAGYLATSHLLRLGHRRIAFLGWSVSHATPQEQRLAGYHRALAEEGCPDAPSALVVPSPQPFHESEEREKILCFLESQRITAIVCGTDFLAVTIERFLLSEGIAIPDDVALVGISDERIAARAEVPLTTVRIPAWQLGVEAARLLVARDTGDRSAAKRIVVPVELIVRRSCGGVPADAEKAAANMDELTVVY